MAYIKFLSFCCCIKIHKSKHSGWFLFPCFLMFSLFDAKILSFSTFITLKTPFPLRDPSFQVLSFLFYSRRENGLRSLRESSMTQHGLIWPNFPGPTDAKKHHGLAFSACWEVSILLERLLGILRGKISA